MTIAGLDHVLIRTAKLEETKNFFLDVLGLHVGPRPPFDFPGYWLYNDGTAIVHLAGVADSGVTAYLGDVGTNAGTGPLDHVSLRCSGYRDVKERLDRHGIAAVERTIPAQGEHQLFVTEPNGLKIELTFAAAELP